MSSTNKTTNYNLSQFIGTDKPAWLSDYNTDMSAIDTQMKLNADAATTAAGSATTANNSIGTLANLTTTAKTDLVSAVNEVNSAAGTAQTTANAANADISSLVSYLDINTFDDMGNCTSDAGSVVYNAVRYASNTGGSLGKVYGTLDVNASSSKDATITFTNKSPFRPSTAIYIEAAGVNSVTNGSINYPATLFIDTDGTVKIFCFMEGNKTNRVILSPCIYFIKDFGDTLQA